MFNIKNGKAMKSAELHLRAALANFWLSDLGEVTLLQFLFPHQNNDNNKISRLRGGEA